MHDLFAAYVKYAVSRGLKCELIDSVHGRVAAQVTGKDAADVFSQEAGSHCVQRIPPTEKNSRRQTSFVMVAVLPMPPKREVKLLPEGELDIKCQNGSGPGGQHQNRTASCVRMTHKPTGLQVYIDGRKQHQNRSEAHRILSAKVAEHSNARAQAGYDDVRRRQIGSGDRGEKVRTYNFIKSRAVDHRSGKKTSKVRDVIGKGRIDLLL